MYQHCVFCSADLGANDVLEEFPVGVRLAFDSWKGRLWAVCPHCTRWSLAPIEERWEAVEGAEKLFRASRSRVHSGNIGLAELAGGLRLVRVGEALPGELAAWRYGSELRKRRWRYWAQFSLMVGVGSVLGFLTTPGLAALDRVVHRVPPEESPTGREWRLRLRELNLASVGLEPEGDVFLQLKARGRWPKQRVAPTFHGEDARMLLERLLLHINLRGAGQEAAQTAVDLLSQAGSVDEYVREVIGGRAADRHAGTSPGGLQLRVRWHGGWRAERTAPGADVEPETGTRVDPRRLLALEMAMHEDVERRALEGELALLEMRWREAEEIAGIADVLPEDPLERRKADSA